MVIINENLFINFFAPTWYSHRRHRDIGHILEHRPMQDLMQDDYVNASIFSIVDDLDSGGGNFDRVFGRSGSNVDEPATSAHPTSAAATDVVVVVFVFILVIVIIIVIHGSTTNLVTIPDAETTIAAFGRLQDEG